VATNSPGKPIEIAQWLRDLGLEQYTGAFVDNAIDAPASRRRRLRTPKRDVFSTIRSGTVIIATSTAVTIRAYVRIIWEHKHFGRLAIPIVLWRFAQKLRRWVNGSLIRSVGDYRSNTMPCFVWTAASPN
jgi:hypothetical protein